MRQITIGFLSLALVAASSSVSFASKVSLSRQALEKQHLQVRWHRVMSLDINCDGSADEIFTGQDAEHFYVAAVLAPISAKSKVSILRFLLRGESQDSFCGPPSALQKESLDYDPGEGLGETPKGVARSRKCVGLKLVAGECDSFHLFWNHKTNALDWWRL